MDVVYNASNNELVRTKTLVKNCIILVDATPFRRWYESHYAQLLGKKKNQKLTAEEEQILNKKRSKSVEKKFKARQKMAKLDLALEEQMQAGRVLGQLPADATVAGVVVAMHEDKICLNDPVVHCHSYTDFRSQASRRTLPSLRDTN